MTAREPVSRTGRPLKFPGSGARVPHSVRLKPAISEKLRAQATVNLRSIGEEIEARIDASFLEGGYEPSSDTMDVRTLMKHFDDRLQETQDLLQKRVDEQVALLAKINNINMKVLQKLVLDRIVDESSSLAAEEVKKGNSTDREVYDQYINHYKEEIGILHHLQNNMSYMQEDIDRSIADVLSRKINRRG